MQMDNRTTLQSLLGRHMPDGALSRKVLLIESDQAVAQFVREWMPPGCQITGVTMLNDAILTIPTLKPDIVLVSGLRSTRTTEAVEKLYEVGPECVMVVMAEVAEAEAVRRAVPEGAVFRILMRPPAREEVMTAMSEAFLYRATLKTLQHLVERCRALESSQARLQQSLADYHERLERTILMAYRYHKSSAVVKELQGELPSLASFAKWCMAQPVAPEQLPARRTGLECLASFCEILGGYHVENSSGRWELKRMRTRMDKLVEEVVAEFNSVGDFPDCVIRTFSNPQIGSAFVDPEWVKEALMAVLVNAAESGPGSTIDVMVDSNDEDERVHISVRDKGCGMDASTAERASEPFFSTRPGRAGLGLAIAKKVAEAHGGQLVVSSRLGSGTDVGIWLPREAPAKF